jgi:ligand-binding SRPBCC domain-containing protein
MQQELDHDSVSMRMEAPPEAVYELFSDVTRMPELSPEILECTWLDGATGPAVGARFKARNKVPNRPAWRNKPVVTVVEPAREFAFERTEPFGGTVEWRYRFEPDGQGTLVTESYTVTRAMGRVGWFIIGTLFARKDRRADLRAGMEQTLERARATVERDAAGSDPPSRHAEPG